MSRWLSICLLAACSAAHGAPQSAADDDMSRFMAERGLLNRLEQVRASVADQAHAVADRSSELVVTAMGFLGVPYRMGGNSIETGFDCSGFVKAMFQQTLGLILPRRAEEQAAATQNVERQELQPGDLVFFNTMRRAFSHVGIYVGEGRFIHSPKPGAEVRVERMDLQYWSQRFDGARRVVAAPNTGAAPGATLAR